jgi:uncharacterized membrane protein
MIKRLFVDGLKLFIPFALTIAILVWLLGAIETFFGQIIQWIIGPQHYFTGLGLLVGIVCVFLMGIVYNAWLTRWIYHLAEKIMRRIPLVKTLYNSIQDLMMFFDKKQAGKYGKVVLFRWQGLELLGLMTREEFHELPEGLAAEGTVAVYLPMSYQIGGYTVHVPMDEVRPIDMPVDAAMRYILTAGMSIASKNGEKK